MTSTKPDTSTPPHTSSALTAAHIALRILLVLNWLYGAAILAGLITSLIARDRLMPMLGIPLSPAGYVLIHGMQAMAVLGLVSIPLHYLVLRRLLDVVGSVRVGTPFVADNASRLQAIAWALLGLQLLSIVIGAIAKGVSTPTLPLRVDAGFSTAGWLAVLLLFVLARVFGEGARMREELEGTI